MPLEFDPTDNDDYAMQQLDKRDSTAMAGVAWYHHERWGTVKASAAGAHCAPFFLSAVYRYCVTRNIFPCSGSPFCADSTEGALLAAGVAPLLTETGYPARRYNALSTNF